MKPRTVMRILAPALLFVVCACAATPRPVAESDEPLGDAIAATEAPDGSTVTIEGIVRLVGAEPFADYVIETEEGTYWYVVDGVEAIAGYEHLTVRVTGTVFHRPMILANGRNLGMRHEIAVTEDALVIQE